MIKKFQIIFLTTFLILSSILQTQEKIRDFPVLKGLYLGQKPPGKKAELFAPDVIDYEVHESPCISQDEKEMLIGSMEEGTKYYKMVNMYIHQPIIQEKKLKDY